MAGRTKRAALVLSEDQEAMLRRLAGSRTAAVREVERARILLGYAQGMPITDLARQVGVSRPWSVGLVQARLTTQARASSLISGSCGR